MTRKDMERLLLIYGQPVFGFCCHLTGSRDAGEELYQDTMLKAIEIMDRIPVPSGDDLLPARNYCMGIAVRLYRNKVRKEALRMHPSLDDEASGIGYVVSDGGTPEDAFLAQQEYRQIRAAIQSLPGKQREAVYLYYYAGQSVAEIADTLDIPQGTVKSRLNSEKKTLRKLLVEDL